MRSLFFFTALFAICCTLIAQEAQDAHLALFLYSEFEDDEAVLDGRELKRGGSRSSGRSSYRSSYKSSRGRVRYYFAAGSNKDKECYKYKNADGSEDIECNDGASLVAIIIASIVGAMFTCCICAYIYKNCCKAMRKDKQI